MPPETSRKKRKQSRKQSRKRQPNENKESIVKCGLFVLEIYPCQVKANQSQRPAGLFEAQTRMENNSKVNFAHVVTQATVCTEGSEHDDNDVLAQI